MPSSASYLRNRCSQIDFSQRGWSEGSGGWKTYVIEELDDVGYFWVDRLNRVIAFGPETWRILGVDQRVRYNLLEQVRDGGASGIRELPMHVSPYLELVIEDARTR